MLFRVKEIKKMEALPGKKYATTYYKQADRDYIKTGKFIFETAQELSNMADAKGIDLTEPLPEFPRTTGTNYSIEDILCDLLQQYQLQRDWPSGMIGRWNKLFKDDPDKQIEFQKE